VKALVEVKPFKGVKYCSEKAGSFSKLVAPPYDIISEKERKLLLKKNQFNFARLSLGNQGFEKNHIAENYTKAAKLVNEWLQKEILVQEKEPAFYVYKNDYSFGGENASIKALFCLLRLEPFENGKVLPHEKTLPKPKQDRLELLKETKCDFEPIMLLDSLQGSGIETIFESKTKEKPEMDFENETGRHRLWVLKDREKIMQIKKMLSGEKMFIADGHHRYETAEKFSEIDGSKASKYKMVCIINLNSNGLRILPTHRALKKVTEKESFVKKLSEFFEVEECEKERMMQATKVGKKPCIGMLFEGKFHLLKNKGKANEALKEKPIVLRDLATVALDTIVFKKILATDLDNISFEKNAEKLIELTGAGEFEAVFFVQPASIKQFENVSLAGEAMPQKSTFFYPKLLSGLVFYKLG